MERAIGRTAHDAEEVCSGLQLFLDHIPQRDAGIYESIHELLSLVRGLGELRLDAVQYKRLPTPIEQDIRLLLQSMSLTMSKVQKMFGETTATKLNGERAYSHVWFAFCTELVENEGGLLLWPRLELYSIFLKQILENLRGEVVEPKSLTRHRQKLSKLFQDQQPQEPGYPSGTPSPTSPRVQFPSMPGPTMPGPAMPGAWPSGLSGSFFPPAPDPSTSRGPSSPSVSTASWSSHTSGSAGSFATHWASLVFSGRYSSTRFSAELRQPSMICGRPMPSALARLAEDRYTPVCKVGFEADALEARFYCRQKDARARLLLLKRDRAGIVHTFCIPLTALKLTRDKATLEFYRMDRELNKYEIWAALNFSDHERLVLFYSIFAAMKNQDAVTPPEGLHDDYFHTKKRPETEIFGGQTIYPPSLRHALRMFHDKYSGGVRLEARPLRGPKMHVPLWTAFITNKIGDPTWLRRVGERRIELKKVEQHIFVDGYIPTLGKNGRLVIDFDGKEDCDGFVAAVNDLRND